MKKVLITGVGGAIGLHMLSHVMHNTDWEVIGIDSFNHKGYWDRLTIVFEEHPEWVERVKIITHDLIAPFTYREIDKLRSVDYIINLASLSDVQASIEDPVPFIRNNSEIMLTMLELAREIDPEVFLHFSTDEVYGPVEKEWRECEDPDCGEDGHSPGNRDHKHEYLSVHPEWDTILPSNPYSASKAAQEAYAIAYWRSYGVPVVITNTMNNFGETQSPSKFPAMVQNQIDKGERVKIHTASDGQIGTRYYLHSRNAADAVLFILKNTTPHLHDPGQIDKPDRYNIVGDIQLDNLELATKIAVFMDKSLDFQMVNFHAKHPGHDLHYGLDGAKLASLGWKSPKSFEDSMRETIKWQQEHPEWLR